MDVLVAFNFNALPVLHYLLSTVIEDVEKIETVKDKIERLHYWLKQVNQVPVSPNWSFYNDREAASHFLNTWLCEEIRYYEKAFSFFQIIIRWQFPAFQTPGLKLKLICQLPKLLALPGFLWTAGFSKTPMSAKY